MKIIGKVKQVLPAQEITSKKGNQFFKYLFLFSTGPYETEDVIVVEKFCKSEDEYPSLAEGQNIEAYLKFESREWNGRYFMQANLENHAIIGEQISNSTVTEEVINMSAPNNANVAPTQNNLMEAPPAGAPDKDDLPF